jgi:hypothetical protein
VASYASTHTSAVRERVAFYAILQLGQPDIWFQLANVRVTTFSEQFSHKPTDGSWDDRIPRTACNSGALRDVYTL